MLRILPLGVGIPPERQWVCDAPLHKSPGRRKNGSGLCRKTRNNAKKPPRSFDLRGLQRSARDSNPQALSGARFRGECITILPALQMVTARRGFAAEPTASPRAGLCPGDAFPTCRACSRQHADLQPPIGAPGFEPGTSATRTQRSTGLSHAPYHDTTTTNGVGLNSSGSRRARPRRSRPTFTDGVGFEPTWAFAHTISNRAP